MIFSCFPMAESFKGKGLPLDQAGMDEALNLLDIDGASVWSVISVETSGVGFLSDRRPKILFERHVFSRLTKGKYDESHPDISNPQPGGYGPSGAHQYERLWDAMALDHDAALMSSSWGLGQVMGFNFQAAGFAGVEEMVSAMKDSEGDQLMAMMRFVKNMGLDGPLREKDWQAFARGYNGQEYAEKEYDRKLESFHDNYSRDGLPDLDVRAAQLYLVYLGYDPGPIDGLLGSRTLSALNQFLEKEGRPPSDSVTQDMLDLLSSRAGDI